MEVGDKGIKEGVKKYFIRNKEEKSRKGINYIQSFQLLMLCFAQQGNGRL